MHITTSRDGKPLVFQKTITSECTQLDGKGVQGVDSLSLKELRARYESIRKSREKKKKEVMSEAEAEGRYESELLRKAVQSWKQESLHGGDESRMANAYWRRRLQRRVLKIIE